MKIRKAVKFILLGKKVKRKDWTKNNWLEVINTGELRLLGYKAYEFLAEDLLADDWEVINENTQSN